MINKVILVGNLGKDPESRFTANGNEQSSFSLATTSKYKDEQKTEWHNIVTFGNAAKFCNQYLKKGNKIYLEGKIQYREWEKDGVKHYRTEILADNVQSLGGGNKEEIPF